MSAQVKVHNRKDSAQGGAKINQFALQFRDADDKPDMQTFFFAGGATTPMYDITVPTSGLQRMVLLLTSLPPF